jgi:hypothetical protein
LIVRIELPAGRLAVTPKELKQLLPRMSRPSLYKLARRLGIREGRRLLIPRAALEDWLAKSPRAADLDRAEGEVRP